jgi:hypothetical protein
MKTQDFEIWLGRNKHQCKSLKECKQAYVDYRNAGLTGTGRFFVNEARVRRNGIDAGVFTYNGKFWRFER